MPVGKYSSDELMNMSAEAFLFAKEHGFVKPVETATTVLDAEPSPRPRPQASPTPEAIFPNEDPYGATAEAWLTGEYDWRTPGGKLVRLKPFPLEQIAASGMLDKLTRLPGITSALITKSQGQPPAKAIDMKDQAGMLIEVLNSVLPLCIAQPEVHPVPDPEDKDPEKRQRVPGRIYIDSVPLPDRIAILTEVVGGVEKWDNFREQS
jgi:hypothetical protein